MKDKKKHHYEVHWEKMGKEKPFMNPMLEKMMLHEQPLRGPHFLLSIFSTLQACMDCKETNTTSTGGNPCLNIATWGGVITTIFRCLFGSLGFHCFFLRRGHCFRQLWILRPFAINLSVLHRAFVLCLAIHMALKWDKKVMECIILICEETPHASYSVVLF